uniref:CID domain-containing protein n=1 Tax=Hippocampus comes TaxID=109280 RepID=A0A3Q2XK97_HIPCM
MEAGRGRDSGASFEAVLDKKLLSVTNTMDSIQGLSAWCIEYKKYHGMIVRQWIKCLKKCKWQYMFRSRDVDDHSVLQLLASGNRKNGIRTSWPTNG